MGGDAVPSAGLVMGLSGLTFCDSGGVGVLVLLLRHSGEQRSALVLSGISPQLKRVLASTGLATAFQIEASVTAAVAAVRASSGQAAHVSRGCAGN